MHSYWYLRMLVASLAFATGLTKKSPYGWRVGRFKTLVTFGDSYTDENRIDYFNNNNGLAPPVGWDPGMGFTTSSGGLSWSRYASIYSESTLYNYAVSGAVCSNQITPRRFFRINALRPDLAGYQLPAFIADSKYHRPNGIKYFTGKPDSTVYAIWIGTNDLGNGAFLTDSQIKGKSVADYVDCVYEQVSRLHEHGARSAICSPRRWRAPATYSFPTKAGQNATAINGRMHATVAALNQVFKYRTPYEVGVQETSDDIHIASFDVNALMTDIYNRPAEYLNGTAPLNVQGVVKLCDTTGAHCKMQTSPDSYLWYDPLHPSEQTNRVVASEFVKVVSGKSEFATYWG